MAAAPMWRTTSASATAPAINTALCPRRCAHEWSDYFLTYFLSARGPTSAP